jgi:hypothetical protein
MSSSPKTPPGFSGSPVPENDCPSCQKSWSRTELKRAALHPALRGSPNARRSKDIHFQVCELCDRVYSEHFESRERYTYFRFVGENALPLLTAESTFPDFVRWAAEHSSEEGWMVEALSSTLLKRRPQDLQPGVDAIFDHLRGGVAPASNMGVWRAAKDDLRPPPGNKPIRRLETGPEDLAWALVVIDDLSPLWQVLDDIVMDESIEVPSRGYLLKTCWESLGTLRQVGARPGNEHVLFMPEAEWQSLSARLDRVSRLAFSVERLLQACDSDSEALNTVFNDDEMNIQSLVNEGGRIAPPALRRLKAKLESLGSPADGAKIDNIVYRSLYPVVWRAEKADACDCEPAVIAEALGIAHLQ